MKRPLIIISFVFLVSFLIQGYIYNPAKMIISFIMLVVFAVLLIIYLLNKKNIFFVISLIAFSLSFSSILSYSAIDLKSIDTVNDFSGIHVSEVIITKTKYTGSGYEIKEGIVKKIDEANTNFKSTIIFNYNSHVKEGDKIRLSGDISGAVDYNNPIEKFKNSYNLSKGLILNITSDSVEDIELVDINVKLFPYTQINVISNKIDDALSNYLREDAAAMCKSLVCSDKTDLSKELKNGFSALGISHLLAVSGLHLGIIAYSLNSLLRLLQTNRKIRIIILSSFCFSYCFICSFAISVCRAFLMFLIMQLSFFARRKNDSLTSLFLAADIICIISPYSIFDIGFILSFFATLGIITIAVPIINLIRIKNKFIKWVINCFIVTISANTFILPITAIYFNSISIISPISNLIFIPILTITIYCSFIYLALYFVPFAPAVMSFIINGISGMLNNISKIGANNHFSIKTYGRELLIISLCFLFITILLSFLFRKKHYLFYICSFLLCLFIIVCSGVNEYLNIKSPGLIYKNDSKNDAIIISNKGFGAIIDITNGGYTFLSNCIELSNDYHIEIDTLILTHFHNYHINTLNKLIINNNIKNVCVPSNIKNKEQITDLLKELHCNIFIYNKIVDYNNQMLVIEPDYSKYSHPTIIIDIQTPKIVYTSHGYNSDNDNSNFNTYTQIIGVHGNKNETILISDNVINGDEYPAFVID